MTEEGDNGEYFNPEEEVKITGGECKLEKVEVKTGEEGLDLIYKGRAVLFRLRDKEWKERGRGDIKLLRDNKTKKIRFILRQDQILKVVANFLVSEQEPLCILKPYQGSDKIYTFSAMDFSEEEQGHLEIFNIKLGNADKGKAFKDAFEAAREFNKLSKEGKESELKYAPIIKDDKDDMKVDIKKEDIKKEENKE